MKQKTIATRHLRTKIAAGYVLILFVIFGIVYIWLNEQHRRQELEITSQKIRCLRKDIHEVYVKMVDLSLIGETVLDWNEEDMNIYHKKRLEVDSLLSLFKSSYRSERIDSVCRLLAEKENLLNKIMLVLNEQEEIKDKIARRVPVIARKSSQEEPPKRKRTGFLGLFGKKEEAKPTVTTSMLNTLNSDVITLIETDFEAGKPLFYRTSGTGSITFSAESAAGVELVTTPATDSFMVGTMSVDTPTAGYFLKNGNIYPIANGDKVKVKSFRAYVKGQNDASQASVMSVNVARP
ncbi:hypothetical protein H6A61_06410 [Bacteroides caecigallinarum]|uniref:hypothetical protein n=1 Tax=Bacteroides caecigallinarum TaxID=1411144 RepID=UPI00195D31C7|nr:hypothetical protein [Bacteroides caecigallinarum]MBM6960486.1 hypothetical protein [Bacteroides caecigallinarum]